MSLEKDIEELVERYTPLIRDAFLLAIRDVVDRTLLVDMVAAIQVGDTVGAFRALGMTEAALRPIAATIEQAFEAGGVTTGNSFPRRLSTPGGRAVFRFDVRDARAERWLREESSRLVTRIADDTRVNVQTLMTDGVRAGRHPRSVALDIVGRIDPVTKRRTGGVVGLSAPQERAVARARQELQELDANYFSRERRDKRFDNIVRNAIDNDKPLTSEQISKLTGRYKDSLLQLRGEMIGRTESIAALNKSEMEAVKQAVDMGSVQESAVKRIWDSAGRDGRTRSTHLQMEGQAVGLDEPFTAPGGAKLMHPGDSSLGAPGSETIACRCRVKLKIDWLSDLD